MVHPFSGVVKRPGQVLHLRLGRVVLGADVQRLFAHLKVQVFSAPCDLDAQCHDGYVIVSNDTTFKDWDLLYANTIAIYAMLSYNTLTWKQVKRSE